MPKIVKRLQAMNALSGRTVKRVHLSDVKHACTQGAGCEMCGASPAKRREVRQASKVAGLDLETLRRAGFEVVIHPITRKRSLKYVGSKNPTDPKGS